MCVMLASEHFQQVVVPRLQAQTDPVDSEFLQDRCLARRNAAWICFGAPLDQSRKVERFAKATQQHFQLRNVQRGRRAAAEINRGWNNGKVGALRRPDAAARRPYPVVQFADERLTKSPRLRPIEQIFVKSAIWTDARAKGNVNIDVADHFMRPQLVISLTST